MKTLQQRLIEAAQNAERYDYGSGNCALLTEAEHKIDSLQTALSDLLGQLEAKKLESKINIDKAMAALVEPPVMRKSVWDQLLWHCAARSNVTGLSILTRQAYR